MDCRTDFCNGNGTCKDDVNPNNINDSDSKLCICDKGYVGVDCQYKCNEKQSEYCESWNFKMP